MGTLPIAGGIATTCFIPEENRYPLEDSNLKWTLLACIPVAGSVISNVALHQKLKEEELTKRINPNFKNGVKRGHTIHIGDKIIPEGLYR